MRYVRRSTSRAGDGHVRGEGRKAAVGGVPGVRPTPWRRRQAHLAHPDHSGQVALAHPGVWAGSLVDVRRSQGASIVTMSRRLRRLERLVEPDGSGYPACALCKNGTKRRIEIRRFGEDQAPPPPCPSCGRDVTYLINIHSVQPDNALTALVPAQAGQGPQTPR
jgi:hypothetical protein